MKVAPPTFLAPGGVVTLVLVLALALGTPTGCSFQPPLPDGVLACAGPVDCPAPLSCVPGASPGGGGRCCREATCGARSGRDGAAAGGDGPGEPGGQRSPGPNRPGPDEHVALDGAPAVEAGRSEAPPPDASVERSARDVGAELPVTADATPTAPAEPALELEGRLLHLRFEDLPEAGSFLDSSKHRHRVALHQLDPSTAVVPGRAGKGLRLPGGPAGGYLSVPPAEVFGRVSAGFSAAAWVRLPDGPPAPGAILARRAVGAKGHLFIFEITAEGLRGRINSSNGYFAAVTARLGLPLGRWAHLAMTYDGAMVKLFIDGQTVGQEPYAHGIASELSPLTIGAAEDPVTGAVVARLDGVIDDVLLVERALSPIEVATLAGAGGLTVRIPWPRP